MTAIEGIIGILQSPCVIVTRPKSPVPPPPRRPPFPHPDSLSRWIITGPLICLDFRQTDIVKKKQSPHVKGLWYIFLYLLWSFSFVYQENYDVKKKIITIWTFLPQLSSSIKYFADEINCLRKYQNNSNLVANVMYLSMMRFYQKTAW